MISPNIDASLLKRTIIKAQDLHIKPLIGSVLFDRIVSEIDGGTVSQDIKDLLDDYIHPALIAWCEYLIPIHLVYKYTNKTVSKNTSEYGQPISSREAAELRREMKSGAENYATRLMRFLEQDQTETTPKYPEYCPDTVECDTILPEKKVYTSSINLDDPFKQPTHRERYKS